MTDLGTPIVLVKDNKVVNSLSKTKDKSRSSFDNSVSSDTSYRKLNTVEKNEGKMSQA